MMYYVYRAGSGQRCYLTFVHGPDTPIGQTLATAWTPDRNLATPLTADQVAMVAHIFATNLIDHELDPNMQLYVEEVE